MLLKREPVGVDGKNRTIYDIVADSPADLEGQDAGAGSIALVRQGENGLMYVKTKTAWEEIDGTGGSGGGSKGRLLGTYSTDEDVNAMEIDISGFGEYDYLVFRLNIELATANWIYLWANGSNTNKYLTNVKTHNEDIPYMKYPGGWAAVMTDSTGTGVYLAANKANSLSFVPYSTSAVIKSGSFIELYGYQALPERDED